MRIRRRLEALEQILRIDACAVCATGGYDAAFRPNRWGTDLRVNLRGEPFPDTRLARSRAALAKPESGSIPHSRITATSSTSSAAANLERLSAAPGSFLDFQPGSTPYIPLLMS